MLWTAETTTEKPKKRAAKKPKAPADPNKPKTSDIYKIVATYLTKVRRHDKGETVGVFRNIQRLVEKDGIPLADVLQAVQNYAQCEWVRSKPEVSRYHIRTFFKPERIKQWLEISRSNDQSLAALDRLTKAAMAQQVPSSVSIAKPAPVSWKAEEEEEEPFEL